MLKLSRIATLVLALPLTACITEEQKPAQELVVSEDDDQGTSLPPEATSDLASEKVTNKVTAERKEPALTPDDIEADNDPMKIGFQTARWDLSDVGLSRIQSVAEELKGNQGKSLKIDGHCDERGTDEYNQVLSEKRAKAVYDALVKMGVDKKRLSFQGYGRKKALVKGHSEKVYSHNRRVEMILSE
jgi:peptidoglycan-associated lipoprotein